MSTNFITFSCPSSSSSISLVGIYVNSFSILLYSSLLLILIVSFIWLVFSLLVIIYDISLFDFFVTSFWLLSWLIKVKVVSSVLISVTLLVEISIVGSKIFLVAWLIEELIRNKIDARNF